MWGTKVYFMFCRVAEARFALSAYGGLGCEAASSLAVRVSWLIFEPWSQKLPMKVL